MYVMYIRNFRINEIICIKYLCGITLCERTARCTFLFPYTQKQTHAHAHEHIYKTRCNKLWHQHFVNRDPTSEKLCERHTWVEYIWISTADKSYAFKASRLYIHNLFRCNFVTGKIMCGSVMMICGKSILRYFLI